MKVANTATPFDVQRADTAEMPFNIISKDSGAVVARVCLLGDAEFIKRACNAYDGLPCEATTADKQWTPLQELNKQLVEALKLAAVSLKHSHPIAGHYSEAAKRHRDARKAVDEALAAAGAA
jgi:hypothetical protein